MECRNKKNRFLMIIHNAFWFPALREEKHFSCRQWHCVNLKTNQHTNSVCVYLNSPFTFSSCTNPNCLLNRQNINFTIFSKPCMCPFFYGFTYFINNFISTNYFNFNWINDELTGSGINSVPKCGTKNKLETKKIIVNNTTVILCFNVNFRIGL